MKLFKFFPVAAFVFLSMTVSWISAQEGSDVDGNQQEKQCDSPASSDCKSSATCLTQGSLIQVRLSVQNQICSPSTNPPYNSTFFLSNVVEGNSLLCVMLQAQQYGFTFNCTLDPTFGAFITSVGGVAANSDLHQYWALIDAWTGQFLSLGASSYKPINGDNILFKLSLY